jgi:hypothetical protein
MKRLSSRRGANERHAARPHRISWTPVRSYAIAAPSIEWFGSLVNVQDDEVRAEPCARRMLRRRLSSPGIDGFFPTRLRKRVISDKILVPVDGSEASDRAVHFAADLASGYAAEVIVTQVCEQECLYGVGVSFEGSTEPGARPPPRAITLPEFAFGADPASVPCRLDRVGSANELDAVPPHS